MRVTSYVAMVTCYHFNFKHEFKSPKDTLWCYKKDINVYLKFTVLEKCLHYLMITPRYNAPHLKSPSNQNRRAAFGPASNEITGGGGFQQVCGRPALALSSALVPQTLSCLVCVEDF